MYVNEIEIQTSFFKEKTPQYLYNLPQGISKNKMKDMVLDKLIKYGRQLSDVIEIFLQKSKPDPRIFFGQPDFSSFCNKFLPFLKIFNPFLGMTIGDPNSSLIHDINTD